MPSPQGEDDVVPYESMERPESVSERLYALMPGKKLASSCVRASSTLLRKILVPQVRTQNAAPHLTSRRTPAHAVPALGTSTLSLSPAPERS